MKTVDKSIQDFVACRRVAVVGATRDGRGFGNVMRAELAARGVEVFLVHPEAREIGGVACHPTLADLRGRVDGVFVSVAPGRVAPVLRDAAAIGVRHGWLMQGAESREALALARELELDLVAKRCPLLYLEPVKSIHKVHRVVAGWFGQL